MKKHADPVGLECIEVLKNEVIPIDTALINGDMVAVAEILSKILPYVRKMVPHLKDENLQKTIENTADEAEKIIAILEAGGDNISEFNTFMESITVNLSSILTALVDRVVNLVDNVLLLL